MSTNISDDEKKQFDEKIIRLDSQLKTYNSYANKDFLYNTIDICLNEVFIINRIINGTTINTTITLKNALNNFINNQTNVASTYYYDTLIASLNIMQDFIIYVYPIFQNVDRVNCKFRYLAIIDDGTVIADSSKKNNIFGKGATAITTGSADPLSNLYISNIISSNGSGYLGKAINENHHSRPEMLFALFNTYGYCKRYSTSIKSKLYYIAKRLGGLQEENIGMLRFSIQI